MGSPEEAKYTTNVGDRLVIEIIGAVQLFIAEVTQENPLRLKVEEGGPYANLKEGDYIIEGRDSHIVQQDDERNECSYLLWRKSKGLPPVISGLKSLGAPSDGKLYEILPAL